MKEQRLYVNNFWYPLFSTWIEAKGKEGEKSSSFFGRHLVMIKLKGGYQDKIFISKHMYLKKKKKMKTLLKRRSYKL